MSQVDELLTASVMSNTSTTEEHIIVGKDRFITVPDALKKIGVQYDHNIDTVTFDCPRYWDDWDLSQMKIYINYMRSDGIIGSYLCENVTVDPLDNDILHFDWIISGHVTEINGTVTFLVCIRNVDGEGNLLRYWNSELNMDMYISEGLHHEKSVLRRYPDIITQLLTRMETVEVTNEAWKDETYTALDEHLAENEKNALSYMNSAKESATEAAASATEAIGYMEEAAASAANAENSAERAEAAAGSITEGVSTTTERRLINSKAGVLKINSMDGESQQKRHTGKNLVNNTGTTTVTNGITKTVNPDKSITLNGTSTARTTIFINNALEISNTSVIATAYSKTVAGVFHEVVRVKADGTLGYSNNNVGGSFKVELSDEEYISKYYILVNQGVTLNNLTLYPMIRLASVEDDTYEPFVGNQPSPNPNYPQEIESVEVGEIKSVRKNFLENIATSKTENGGTIVINDDKSVTINGTFTATTYVNLDFGANRMKLIDDSLKGKDIIFSISKSSIGGVYGSLAYHDENSGVHGIGTAYTSLQAVFPEDAYHFRTYIVVASGVTYNNVTVYPMIRLASVEDDTYEPYTESKITLSNPITLRGIGDVKDVLCKRDGVYKTVQRINERPMYNENIIVTRVDGWTNPNAFSIENITNDIRPNDTNIKADMLCSHFQIETANKIVWNTISGYIGQSGKYLYVSVDGITDAESLKNWLRENQPTLSYVLAEPIITDLPLADQIALHQLETFGTVTYLSTDSEIEPIMEVTYATSITGALALKNEAELASLDERLTDLNNIEIYGGKLGEFVLGSGYNNSVPLYKYRSIVYYKDRFFSIGGSGGSGGAIYSSEDGLDWSPVKGGFMDLSSLSYVNNKLIATGRVIDNGLKNVLCISNDGDAWEITYSTDILFGEIYDIAYNDNTYVGVGLGGKIYYSTDDAITWTQATSNTTGNLRAVVYGSDKFVAVGETARTVYSTDGVTWDIAYNSNSHNVIYANNQFHCVSDAITKYSHNGINWVDINPPYAFSHLTYANNIYIGYCDNIPYVSADGRMFTPMQNAIYMPNDIVEESYKYAVAFYYANGKLLVGGPNCIYCSEVDSEVKTLEKVVSEVYNKKMPYAMLRIYTSYWTTDTTYADFGYKYQVSVSDYYDIYPEYFLKTLTSNLLPTLDEQTAFDLIGGMVFDVGSMQLTFYATTKPTTDILVVVKGVTV